MATGDPFVWCMHHREGGHDKFYAVAILHAPGGRYSVQAWWGRASASSAQAGKVYYSNLGSVSQAQTFALAMAAKKANGGYKFVNSPTYAGPLSQTDIHAKIEMTYVVREGVPSPFSVAAPPPKPKPVVPTLPMHADPITDRNRRVVDV